MDRGRAKADCLGIIAMLTAVYLLNLLNVRSLGKAAAQADYLI